MQKMTCCLILCLLVGAFAGGSVCAQAGEPTRPTVKVTGGSIQGRLLPAGGAVFKGIPFAAAPVGDLRWQEPAPVKPWKGVRDAGEFGPPCVQDRTQEGSEDCLYLNVWTRAWPARERLPVMFWIHGGSNVNGSALSDVMDGASIVRKGVVFVSIHYRLNVFGFFAHPALRAESPNHASGNYGMLDQVAALKWVRENISRFGGDPGNVTVFGQSAGAVDTGFLIASPLARGLFQRGIQESGPIVRDYTLLKDAEKSGEKLAASLQAPKGAGTLKYLRGLSSEQLRLAFLKGREAASPALAIIDGWFLPESAEQLFAEGKQNRVALIVGTNSQELGGPRPDALRGEVKAVYGINGDKALAYYGLTGPGEGNRDPLFGTASLQFSADTKQRCGLILEAIWHAASKNPVYHYQFDRTIPGQAATHHGSELPYVFGNLLSTGSNGAPFTAVDKRISEDIQGYWTNFAKTGNPNGTGLPNWPQYNPAERAYLEFTDDRPVVKTGGLRRQICDLYMENWLQHMNAIKESRK
jgi:para-nitrobenzyl esterase